MSANDDIIDLDITGVAHGGVFVGRHEGRVVFVPDAIPGERVRVRLTDTGKKSFWRAEALDVLDASPHRRTHVWRQADIGVAPEARPGGADFGHIDLAEQRMLKLQVIRDAMTRIGSMDPQVSIEPARALETEERVVEETADGTAWRTRVSLHVNDAGHVGPYAARSHRVVEVDEFPLAAPEVARAALDLRGGDVGRVDLVSPADGRVRVIPRPDVSRGAGRRGRGRRGPRPVVAADRLAFETVIERAGGRDFRVDAGGFWQVHRLAAHTLTSAVAELLGAAAPGGGQRGAIDPDAWHLDLYGGVGLFAASLGDLGGDATRVTSVESDARATEHAGENLADWIGARAETDRVDRWISRLAAEASAIERDRLSRGVVLLDPPRSGAGREVVEHIAALAPETVVYVACDPVALARDLATFRDHGYETPAISAFDLFPNSHHVEAIAVLGRTGVRA